MTLYAIFVDSDIVRGLVDGCETGVITPEALTAGLEFTAPIQPGFQAFLVKKGNPRNFQIQPDLTGKKIGNFCHLDCFHYDALFFENFSLSCDEKTQRKLTPNDDCFSHWI